MSRLDKQLASLPTAISGAQISHSYVFNSQIIIYDAQMMYCRARSIQKHQPTEHIESTISELHANKVLKGLHMITVQITKA